MPALQLSADEQAFFSENGWVGPFPSPFDPADVDQAVALARHYGGAIRKGDRPRTPIYSYADIDLDAVNPDLPRAFVEYFLQRTVANRDHHLHDAAVYRLLCHPAVAGRVASILGPDVLLWRSQMFPVPPGTEHPRHPGHFLAWHQGANFAGFDGRPTLVPSQSVTAWIALTGADRGRSTLLVMPGTHRLGPVPLTNGGQRGRFYDSVAWKFDRADAIAVECGPGEFVLFDEFLVHGSTNNASDIFRVSLSARYAPTFARLNKETWPFDPTLAAEATDPGAAGLPLPRLKYPLRDCAVDNFGLVLDNWGCVVVHGEDHYGWNRLAP